MSDQWIYAHNWEKWQSGRRQEGAPWIRNYGALLNDDDYLELSPSCRSVLHGVWMCLGSAGNGRLLRRDARIAARLSLSQRTVTRSLDRLNEAGWISFECTKNGRAEFTRLEEIEKESAPARAREAPAQRSDEEEPPNSSDQLDLELAAKTAARIAALTKKAAAASPTEIASPPWIQTNQRLAAQKAGT